MTPKQRVQTALAHQQPDRVPLDTLIENLLARVETANNPDHAA